VERSGAARGAIDGDEHEGINKQIEIEEARNKAMPRKKSPKPRLVENIVATLGLEFLEAIKIQHAIS
jgi:hypothetical protein